MEFLVKSNYSKIFSIVIPVHNSSSFIKDNILSLIGLDFPTVNFEVIFVDDASSDDSVDAIAEVLNFYGAKFEYQILRNENPAGPGIARNAGISSAKGDWILFLDSDDQFIPNALSVLAKNINEQNVGSDLDLIFFDGLKLGSLDSVPIIICKHSCVVDKSHAKKKHHEEIRSVLRLEFDEHVIFCAFSRKFIKSSELKFEPGIYEDVLFISQALILSRHQIHINQSLYIKVSRENQITGSFTMRHAESYLQSRKKIWEWLKIQRNVSHEEFIPDFHFGVRGAMGILYRRSSTEISPHLRIEFDSQLTRIAVDFFQDFEKIISGQHATELDLVCFSRYQQLVALGVL